MGIGLTRRITRIGRGLDGLVGSVIYSMGDSDRGLRLDRFFGLVTESTVYSDR